MSRTIFLRQLRYWTFHCSLNALPSFCIAMMAFELWEKLAALVAILLAITTFIFLYATLTSLNVSLAKKDHVISLALKLAIKIRAWISGLSLLVVFTPAVLIAPDFWCGFLAVFTVNTLVALVKDMPSQDMFINFNTDFIQIYLTTMLEGFILSLMLFGISLIVVIVRRARDEITFQSFSAQD